jgi:hypothetical protein
MPKGNNGTYFEPSLTIKGNNNVSFGDSCIMKGNNNVAHGKSCIMKGNNNVAKEKSTTMKGNNCTYFDGSLPIQKQKKWADPMFGGSNYQTSTNVGSIIGNFGIRSQVNFGPMQQTFGPSGMTQIMKNSRISAQVFVFGSRSLTLTNINVREMIRHDGKCTFKWDNHTLVYQDPLMTYDSKYVDIVRLFEPYGLSTLEMEWSDFILQIPTEEDEASEEDIPFPRIRQRSAGGGDAKPPEIKLPEVILPPPKDEPTDDETKACVICLENLKCCLLSPCMHVCVCNTCSPRIKDKPCPLCRVVVTAVTHVFV